MLFLNTTESIGQIITAGTQNFTGVLVVTLFVVLLFLILICIMFAIPLEFIALIIFPLCLAVGANEAYFMGPIIVIIVYLATLFAKNWIFR